MITPDPRDFEWQRRYVENDTPWVEEIAAPPLAAFLKSERLAGRVLVPGCGFGQEVRALAAQDNCVVTGIDLAAEAVERAGKFPVELGKHSQMDYQVGDFLELPGHLVGSFDWIVEHTCFCAIHPDQRPAYVRAARSALKAGGKLFAIFFMTPDREVGPPFRSTKEELDLLFTEAFDLLEEWVPQEAFEDRQGKELVRILQRRDN